MRDARSTNRVLLLCVVVATLTSACASSPQRPTTINVQLAQVRSAELDAANAYYEATLTQAGEEYAAGKLDAGEFRRVYAAGADLHRALTLAHAEQKLYISGGGNLSTYDVAFTKLNKSRANLSLVWETAHRGKSESGSTRRGYQYRFRAGEIRRAALPWATAC